MKDEVVNKEKEYRKLFMYQKRWAKHWITPSAHRAHSSTMFMIEPAKRTLKIIQKLENDKVSYFERVNKLIEFFYEMNQKEEQVQNRMYNGYYFECYQYLKKETNKVENGEKATIYKMPRA